MNVKKLTLHANGYPPLLAELHTPPKELFVAGNLDEILSRPKVAIVGSRKVSAYGRSVTTKLAGELAKQGIAVVSGLALGVDSLAHQAALDAGGLTLAVLPSPVEKIYPASHASLARKITEQGGALISEYPAGATVYKQNFIARNRIVAGLCDALLITEAALKSGSLHTARFALEQGKDVLAVPGNITSPTSEGTNNLLKHGATPVTCVEDVLHVLGLETTEAKPQIRGANEHEQIILDLIAEGTADGEELLTLSKLEASAFNQTLTMLEITGKIRSLGANQWSL